MADKRKTYSVGMEGVFYSGKGRKIEGYVKEIDSENKLTTIYSKGEDVKLGAVETRQVGINSCKDIAVLL